MSRTVIMATPYYPPEGGGLERYAREIALRLVADHGWRVVFLASGPEGRETSREHDGPLIVHRLGHQVRLSNTRLSARWIRAMRQIIEAEQPDLVNAHAPVPGVADAARWAVGDRPFVVTYHTGSMRKGHLLPDLAIGAYERTAGRDLLGRADWIIASSGAVRDTFLHRVRDKTTVIPPGVDSELFHPAPERPPDRLAFVANLRRSQGHKGLDRLIDALAVLPDRTVTLDVLGGGDGRPGYEEHAARLGLADRVRFRGYLDTAAVAVALRRCGILVLPTSSDSYPLTVLEAMATGLPVVSTPVGGIPEMVEDDATGFLVPVTDQAALVRRVGELVADPARADEMGRAGRDRVETTSSWNARVTGTRALFDAVIGRWAAQRPDCAAMATR